MFSSASKSHLKQRTKDLELLLSAGVREGKGSSGQNTMRRFVEKLASSLGEASDFDRWFARRLVLSEMVASRVDAERKAARRPHLPVRMVGEVGGPSHQSHELVLQTLASLVRAAPVDDPSTVGEPLEELQEFAEEFKPQELFKDWSPARLPPEQQLDTEGARCQATRGADTAGDCLAMIDGTVGLPRDSESERDNNGWSTGKLTTMPTEGATWTVWLRDSSTIASLELDFSDPP